MAMKQKQWFFYVLIYAEIFFLFVSLPRRVYANDLEASLAYLPTLVDSPDKGLFVDLVKAIDAVYTDGSIFIKVYPFVRSLDNVRKGKADFHLPMARSPISDVNRHPYKFASESMGDVVFVIYSHKDNPITKEAILRAGHLTDYPFKIETGRGLGDLFDFPLITSSSIEQSMKKIVARRIDGFIWAQEESDSVLRNLKTDAIHRAFYRTFQDVIVIPDGPKGDVVDRILSQAIRTLKSTGRWQVLHKKIHRPYIEWQPYQMQW
jgi:polar amino acid transport system substrate-binding protein